MDRYEDGPNVCATSIALDDLHSYTMAANKLRQGLENGTHDELADYEDYKKAVDFLEEYEYLIREIENSLF